MSQITANQDNSLPLSVAIITQNEADNLPDCLSSVSFATEVVVVDSGSTDATLDIAKKFGAKVYYESWQGFGLQKQRAIDHCTQPWILIIDADERTTPELAREIREIVTGVNQHQAYSVTRKNFFCGRWLRRAGWWPDRVVRLFQRGTARMSDRLVHETLLADGVVGDLKGSLIHYTNRDLRQTLHKINLYSTAGAVELHKRGEHATVCKAVSHMTWAFINNTIFKLGVLDGGPGVVQALTDAVNTLFKYLKLWEMGQNTRKEIDQENFPKSGR